MIDILKEIRNAPYVMGWRSKRPAGLKSKRPASPKPQQPAAPQAQQQVLIFDAEKGITVEGGEPVGRPWLLKGKTVYLAKHKGDELVPYDPLQEWRGDKRIGKAHSPEALYDAITWREISGVYRLGSSLLEKLNAGLLVVLIGILCFFIYLIYSSTAGV